MKKTVWFTRLLSENEVRQANAAGIEPLVHPLIKLNFFSAEKVLSALNNLPKPDGIIFTSKNGASSFLETVSKQYPSTSKLPFFCLGDATAAPLKESGYEVHQSTVSTGEGLANFVAKHLKNGSNLWHFCSTIKRAETGETLAKLGFNYFPVESYETIETPEAGLPEIPFEAIVFYSPSAARAFSNMDIALNSVPKVVVGETTANELKALSVSPVLIAREASTSGILDILQEILYPKSTT